jgi:outer membrane protein OmpA-like peptidoglycan-associated protein
MPTSHTAPDTTRDAQRRLLHPQQDQRIAFRSDRMWDASRIAAWIFAGATLVFTANGCLATRSWVQDQMNPVRDQLGQQQARLNETDGKADRALAGLQNLHLQQKLVLDSRHGPTFAFGSAALTENARHEIDGFFRDLEGSPNSGSAAERIFVVAGHTDNVGAEDYNYQLGQRRAEDVAGYLVGREGVDPTQIRVISYGESKPIADNRTASGRRSNRRVEILVYQEKIGTAEQAGPTAAQPPVNVVAADKTR